MKVRDLIRTLEKFNPDDEAFVTIRHAGEPWEAVTGRIEACVLGPGVSIEAVHTPERDIVPEHHPRLVMAGGAGKAKPR